MVRFDITKAIDSAFRPIEMRQMIKRRPNARRDLATRHRDPLARDPVNPTTEIQFIVPSRTGA